MPADVQLARRPGVELVRTGRFQTLTGSWNPTPADIKAAVEAMDCPAIRKPVIRLGHSDQRFVGDGEPALGWFENLRATDAGHTLVADQVTLPWLHSVQAAAYPSRSIEGNYNHRCSEGHVHPFVIHTVALLGVTPPGVQTLRSLNDLPDMLGVAASGEVPEGAEHVQVTVLAAGSQYGPGPDGDGDDDDEPTGVIVALVPAADDAARLAIDGGETAEQLHLTLAYLGEAADLDTASRQDLIDGVSAAVNGMPVVDARVFSAAVYNPGDADADRDTCLVYQVSGDLLDAVHDALADALDGIDQSPAPWFAHITAIWIDDLGQLADLAANVGSVSFDRVRIAIAGQAIDIPLIDSPQPDPGMLDYGDPDGISAASASDAKPPSMNAERLKKYWLAGPGLSKWAADPHPWTALYHQLLKYIHNPDEAKRTASQWYKIHFGHMPNQKGVHAAAIREEAVMAAAAVSDKPWNPMQGDYTPAQWKAACLIDSGIGDPDAKKAAAAKLVTLYGQLGEDVPPNLRMAANKKVAASADPNLPAAESEQPNNTQEDSVSLSEDMRSRLGLAEDADETAALAAIDALKTAAEKQPEPTPEMVAASAAATEKAEKAQSALELMKEELTRQSSELATIKASAAATVKASFFSGLVTAGKLKPADRETWEARYDRDPEMVSDILGARADGSEVPVMASGTVGDPEPSNNNEELDREYAALFGAEAK